MANIHPEALAAALAGAAKAPPPGYVQDPNAQSGGGASGGAQTAPQSSATDAEDAQDGGADDAAEQAVWQEFPATDPNNVQALAQQMQGAAPDQLAQLLGQWMQQADADNQKLAQMHEAMLAQLMDALGGMTPGGPASQQPSGPSPVGAGPGVGGNGSGY